MDSFPQKYTKSSKTQNTRPFFSHFESASTVLLRVFCAKELRSEGDERGMWTPCVPTDNTDLIYSLTKGLARKDSVLISK